MDIAICEHQRLANVVLDQVTLLMSKNVIMIFSGPHF